MNTKLEYEQQSLARINQHGVAAAIALLLLQPLAAWAGGVVTSCTEAALRAAMAGGGAVTFACDGTITLASTITSASDTTLDATGRQDKHNGRRDVKEIEPVATCPAYVDHRSRQVFRIDQRIDRATDQLLNKANDLLHALTFAVQRCQEIRLHRVLRRIGKKQRDGDANITGVQIDAGLQSLDERFHSR